MAGNYQNILDHQDCIPEEKLLSYIEGSLSQQEANRVEQHLLECELCSDALEGLRMLHPDKVRAITAELNNKIDQRLDSSKGAKVLPFGSFYRIAAIFVLAALVGGGYWLMKMGKEENNIAMNQKSEPVMNKDSVGAQFEAPAGAVSSQKESASIKKEIRFVPPPISREREEETEQSLAYNTNKESQDDASLKEIVSAKPQSNGATSQADSFFTGNEVALSKIDNSNISANQASNAIEDYSSAKAAPAAAEKDASAAMMDKSNEFSLDKKKESKSEQELQSGAFARQADQQKSITTDEKTIFNRGKSNYDLKKFDIAATDFEILVKDSASKYYDDSKWFLANCYLHTNRNTKARKLLQEISNSNSIHKREAFGLLQEH